MVQRFGRHRLWKYRYHIQNRILKKRMRQSIKKIPEPNQLQNEDDFQYLFKNHRDSTKIKMILRG